MDKVREYINFTFKNPIDREIIYYLHQEGPFRSARHTATAIFSQIPKCNRATFDKRLEALRTPRMNALTRETATPEDIDRTRAYKIRQGEPVPPPPRHRPPFIYRISPALDAKLRDVRGYENSIAAIRIARRLGDIGENDSGLSDNDIIQWFLDREERGIFVPDHLATSEE